MARRSLLGSFASGVKHGNLPTVHERPTSVAVVSHQGQTRPITRYFDFSDFDDCPIITKHSFEIWRQLLKGAAPNTLKNIEPMVHLFCKYVRHFQKTTGIILGPESNIDYHFTHLSIDFLSSEKQRVGKLNFFVKIFKIMGADIKNLPPMPWKQDEKKIRDLLTADQVRKATGMAKNAIRIIQKRPLEVKQFEEKGFDPRRAYGGRQGDWDKPECRYYILKTVFNFEIRGFDEYRFHMDLGGELRGFENRPGAQITTSKGEVKYHQGWLGHLRWIYPHSSDLAPYVILILLRTNINIAALSTLQEGREWEKPCPLKIGDSSAEEFSYIITGKVRGRQKRLGEIKQVRAMSSKTNWSHAFLLLRSVEQLTQPLRNEIARKIIDLKKLDVLSPHQSKELSRLEEIKNDLFVYKSEQSINSLAYDINNKNLKWLTPFLKLFGLPSDSRYLRDAGLSYSFLDSGQNLVILRLIANHSKINTAKAYALRTQTIQHQSEMFKIAATASIALVRAEGFSIKQLKIELTKQGFNRTEATNLVNPDNVTRFGNGCADPGNPPPGFKNGTAPGEPCRSQDCIDGCPQARWFKQSLPHIVKQLFDLSDEHAKLGVETSSMSSLIERIARLKQLLGNWPKKEVDKIMEAERRKRK